MTGWFWTWANSFVINGSFKKNKKTPKMIACRLSLQHWFAAQHLALIRQKSTGFPPFNVRWWPTTPVDCKVTNLISRISTDHIQWDEGKDICTLSGTVKSGYFDKSDQVFGASRLGWIWSADMYPYPLRKLWSTCLTDPKRLVQGASVSRPTWVRCVVICFPSFLDCGTLRRDEGRSIWQDQKLTKPLTFLCF